MPLRHDFRLGAMLPLLVLLAPSGRVAAAPGRVQGAVYTLYPAAGGHDGIDVPGLGVLAVIVQGAPPVGGVVEVDGAGTLAQLDVTLFNVSPSSYFVVRDCSWNPDSSIACATALTQVIATDTNGSAHGLVTLTGVPSTDLVIVTNAADPGESYVAIVNAAPFTQLGS